jgi:hypothetical protein
MFLLVRLLIVHLQKSNPTNLGERSKLFIIFLTDIATFHQILKPHLLKIPPHKRQFQMELKPYSWEVRSETRA